MKRYFLFIPLIIININYQNYFDLIKDLIKAGSNTKFVSVLTTKVMEVNQPNALVPPKSLKQKMIKPATNTKEV
jgi:hypothetical protein